MPNENDPGAGAVNPNALTDPQAEGQLGSAAAQVLGDRQAVRARVKARDEREAKQNPPVPPKK